MFNGGNYDEMVVVLPVNMIEGLLRNGLQPIKVVTERTKKNGQYEVIFDHFERIIKCNILSERL